MARTAHASLKPLIVGCAALSLFTGCATKETHHPVDPAVRATQLPDARIPAPQDLPIAAAPEVTIPTPRLPPRRVPDPASSAETWAAIRGRFDRTVRLMVQDGTLPVGPDQTRECPDRALHAELIKIIDDLPGEWHPVRDKLTWSMCIYFGTYDRWIMVIDIGSGFLRHRDGPHVYRLDINPDEEAHLRATLQKAYQASPKRRAR